MSIVCLLKHIMHVHFLPPADDDDDDDDVVPGFAIEPETRWCISWLLALWLDLATLVVERRVGCADSDSSGNGVASVFRIDLADCIDEANEAADIVDTVEDDDDDEEEEEDDDDDELDDADEAVVEPVAGGLILKFCCCFKSNLWLADSMLTFADINLSSRLLADVGCSMIADFLENISSSFWKS